MDAGHRQAAEWSFCHEQLGHYTSGAPCGLCNVRCVYSSQSCPRCMPADGDELAPGGPLSRVQASLTFGDFLLANRCGTLRSLVDDSELDVEREVLHVVAVHSKLLHLCR